MNISKVKAVFALLTGGVAGVIKYVLIAFNEQVLAKIPNKETGLKYIKDIQAASAFLSAIMNIHTDDFSEARKESLKAILAAVDELAKALEDFNVTQEELDAIIDKVNAAIDAWKKAK